MEVAVNPQLQSAVLDKFARPFADKTRQITDNLDVSVEKQDVVIEKQDKIGDKVKKVISNLERAGDGMKGAFGRSADGLKELSMGFIDIKGIIEEVSKKFNALGDLFAPFAEIGSFAFAGLNFLQGKSRKQEQQSQVEPDDSNIIDGEYEVIDGNALPNPNTNNALALTSEVSEGFKNMFSGINDKIMMALAPVLAGLKAFGAGLFRLTVGLGAMLIPVALFALKGLAVVAALVAVATAIGLFISALNGWDAIGDTINMIQNVFGRFANGVRSLILGINDLLGKVGADFLSKKDREAMIEKNEKEVQRRNRVNAIAKDRDRVNEIGAMDISKEEKLKKIREEGLTTKDSKYNESGQLVNAQGDVLQKSKEEFQADATSQAELDILALESARRLPELEKRLKNARNDSQRETAQKAIEAANNFINKYNETNEVSAQDRLAKLQSENKRVNLRTIIDDVESDIGGIDINNNNMGMVADRYISKAKQTGEKIAEQTAEGKTTFLDSKLGRQGQLAQIMAPSLQQNITSAYVQQGQPAVAEALSK